MDFLTQPFPWYIGGPLIGLTIPLLLIFVGQSLGISSSFRHVCAACNVGDISFFKYDWKTTGAWNLAFVLGITIGGFLAGNVWLNPEPIDISASTITALQDLGFSDFSGFVPDELFSWSSLSSPTNLAILIIGGFLVGFGTRYAGGCTSGHAISGLSDLQFASLIAVVGFFIGGLLMTHVLYPIIFGS